ncbi:MAPK/MAK/MRK overlapping kinase-like [Montipora capricornis]|uniref:MAPK/MAK/MRK overlapping kinase-like n=1 Tax=Montipora capricornis TaxID=246305 RepID=UPI0035F1213F
MQKYRILGKKGEGTFSEVLKVQDIQDGTYFACKKMKQRYESIDQVNNLREIQAMRRLNPHGNVVDLKDIIFDKKSGTLALICELMDMNLYEMIRGRRHYISESKVKNYMYQLCKSIDHMHRNGIFHRDVKPENILIKDDVVKLADFGSCRSVYSKQPFTEYISTRWYRAPECLLTDGYYSYKMDMWSVGCVFFEVLSLRPLFPGSNEVDQIAKIHEVLGTPSTNILKKLQNKSRSMNFNFPAKTGTGLRVLLPHDHVSKECIELIELMCTYDPDERITAKQALRHPYFKQLREQDRRQSARLVSPDGSLVQSKPHRVVKKKRKHIIGQNRARSPSESILPKEGGFKSLTGGIVANQQPTLPSLGIGYKQNTYGTTLPKIPVATTTHRTTFPTSFHSIIQQEKNKVKNQTSQKFGHFTLPAIDNSKRPGDHGL